VKPEVAQPGMAVPEPTRLPAHVAIIMDGNRRWARARGKPPVFGHQRGAEAVRRTVEACARLGIRYLTFYAFSSENWRRPPQEVDQLMELLRHYLKSEIDSLHEKGVRIRVIGERAGLAPDIVAMIEEAERRTRDNGRIDVLMALNYGGRQEIVRACRRIVEAVCAGRLDPASIDERRFSAFLDTAGIPDPDLLIRTSGEQRISNFLLWQLAYTELVFLPVLWPDFGEEHLVEALVEYARRERRYGAAAG